MDLARAASSPQRDHAHDHARRQARDRHRILTRKPHMCVNLRDEIAKPGTAALEIINYYGAEMPEDAYSICTA